MRPPSGPVGSPPPTDANAKRIKIVVSVVVVLSVLAVLIVFLVHGTG